jgi:hypothetical protein
MPVMGFFYLIAVTDALKKAISTAFCPSEGMIVFQFIPLYQTVPITVIMAKRCGHWKIRPKVLRTIQKEICGKF